MLLLCVSLTWASLSRLWPLFIFVASFHLFNDYLLIFSLLCITEPCRFWCFSSLWETKSAERRNIIPSARTRHWIKAEDCVTFMKNVLRVSVTRTVNPFPYWHIRTFPTYSLWGPKDNDGVHIRVLCSYSPEEFITIILDQTSLHQFFKWSLYILSRGWLQLLVLWVTTSQPSFWPWVFLQVSGCQELCYLTSLAGLK